MGSRSFTLGGKKFSLDAQALKALPEAEQEAVLNEFRALEKRVKANPLEVYEPHEKQTIYHASRHPTKLFAGGNRSGKTTAGLADDLIQTLPAEVVPEHLRQFKHHDGPFFCRVGAPSLVDNLEGVIYPKLKALCPPAALRGDHWDKAFSKTQRMLHFKNGSWWQFLSYEMELDKWAGPALHRTHFDEEPPEDIRSESLMRLVDYDGDECLTMTPLFGMSWVFDEIYEPWSEGKMRGEILVVEVDIDDNPHVSERGKKRRLAGYSAEELAARKSGKFVHFSGLIYDEFRDHHVIPQGPVPEGCPVYCGIDPGIAYMCAVIWAYQTPDDQIVVFDELPAKDATIAEVCQAIRQNNMEWGVTPRWYVIDPSARNRDKQTGRSDQQEFADNGISTMAGQNPVHPGINRVKERLAPIDPITAKKGEPRLFVTANCDETIREFKRYRWKAPKKSRDGEQDDRRARPIKKDDHLLDALRYLVMQRSPPPDRELQPEDKDPRQKMIRDDIAAQGSNVAHQYGPGIYA